MGNDIDLRYWSFLVLGLLSLMLLMGGLAQWWLARERARSHERLSGLATQSVPRQASTLRKDLAVPRSGAAPVLHRWLSRLPGLARYEIWLQQTGWPLRSTEVVLGCAGLALGMLVLAALLGLPLGLALLVAAAAVALVQVILSWRRAHRARQLEQQLPDALSLVARSMQAGHAFSSALQIAAQESPAPMGSELRSVFSEIQYGESANEALSHWAERVAGQDVRIFVIAVRIQSETGGNLAELLHQTAALIRERQKLRGVVRVLSAEGRISALVLTLLPFVLGSLLTALNPAFMSQLWTDPMGLRVLTLALALMGVGTLWMWQMVRAKP